MISCLPMFAHLKPVDLRFNFLTCHISGLATTLTLLSLRTSLPWPPPSTCSSNYTFRRRKGIHTRSPTVAKQQLNDVSVLHNACTIQQVTHIEFRMLEHLGCELETLTPMVLQNFSPHSLIRLPRHTFRIYALHVRGATNSSLALNLRPALVLPRFVSVPAQCLSFVLC